MTCDLTNPAFTNEAKAREFLEASRWPDARRFSLMKRAVFGTHHSISEAHLPRYLVEWDFKWNARKITDGERAALALKGIEGKRLTYRIPH